MDGPSFSNAMAVIYLLGATQGLFLAAVLASRHRNALPNRLLAAVVLVFSIDLAMAVYHATDASAVVPALIGLDLPIGFLYGPLFYLYVRTFTAERPEMKRTDLWHLAPFVLLSLFLVPYYLLPGTEKLALLNDPGASFQTGALTIINPLKLVHGFVYIALVVALLRRHRARVRDQEAPVDSVSLRWLRALAVSVLALLTVVTVLYAAGVRDHVPTLGMDPSAIYDDLTLLSVTVFVYALGYFGLRHPSLFAPDPASGATVQDHEASPAPEAPSEPAYARSGMRPEEAARHRERLLALMETEHIYRRGDLTLSDLADALGITPHNLTEVLNTHLGQSYYDFVNGYRVREVQERLVDPACAHLTVLAIGMEAGFNAKSSFNAAFKRLTGLTPSAYRQRQNTAA
ncbi:helix-turn-helix domain-containing protein [Rubricoccus marinus]|uniref:HTH araC/xylS-type domain-containing protein n=1 Tax=Rubricoccus marinus TaxID=716817 RepID=A0A259TWK3_9BACT|nr:helix-turn-helix transcriptional regulator [Rubricoccus marinus]OZC02080.1 hypothetical protein BSZ36_03225 [Rubricoccus marinus]